MKVFYLFLIALLIVGCGPSAEQMTATADAARAQTQTAAPTLTPTATFTPSPSPTVTSSPTVTASPTPSIPKVQGRIQINFLALDKENTIVPNPPHNISFTLNDGTNDVIVTADETDGSFTTYLTPGKYALDSVTIQNPVLGEDGIKFSTDEPEIVVTDNPCVNVGGITISIFRLPNVDFGQQLMIVQGLNQRGINVFFTTHSEGGFLLPAFTEIAGDGNCPDLPAAPEGFEWKHLPDSSLAVLSPSDWNFLSEGGGTAQGYFISQENITTEGSFKTGLTIQVIRDEEQSAVQVAKSLPSKTMELAGVEPVDVEERTEGDLTFYEFEYQQAFTEYSATVHNLVVTNAVTNTLYVIVFESPTDQWEAAWAKGQVMLEQLLFLDNQ